MHGTFIVALLLLLIRLSSTDSFKFTLQTNFTNARKVNSKFWTSVEVIDHCNDESNIKVKVEVPIILSADYPPVSLFFANELKRITQIDLKELINGTKYSCPYRVEKKMNGAETIRSTSSEFYLISGEFPRTWLPPNSTKISANVQADDGTHFNYYGILNFKISFLDLMVVEEYKNYKCDS